MDAETAKIVETADEPKGSGFSTYGNRKKRGILLGGREMVDCRGFRERGRAVVMVDQKGSLIGG